MPTFAPASGCPPSVETLPLKTTFCAEATLAANATSAVTAARLGNVRWSHERSMTDLAWKMDDDFEIKSRTNRSSSIDEKTSAIRTELWLGGRPPATGGYADSHNRCQDSLKPFASRLVAVRWTFYPISIPLRPQHSTNPRIRGFATSPEHFSHSPLTRTRKSNVPRARPGAIFRRGPRAD